MPDDKNRMNKHDSCCAGGTGDGCISGAASRNGNYDYEPKQVEAKWQGIWRDNETYVVTEDPLKPKYYLLEMFPYPSGELHVGHVRNYTIGDVITRYKRARGYNVLHPMGWDSFGLPAENAAIDRGIRPDKWTWDNIAHMRERLKMIGFSTIGQGKSLQPFLSTTRGLSGCSCCSMSVGWCIRRRRRPTGAPSAIPF